MKDIDHKISREIVNTAKKHKAKVIKLERLETFAQRQEQVVKTILVCIYGLSID